MKAENAAERNMSKNQCVYLHLLHIRSISHSNSCEKKVVLVTGITIVKGDSRKRPVKELKRAFPARKISHKNKKDQIIEF